jgi:1,2-diacylglycerol 3-alpha-glucosyltransferase
MNIGIITTWFPAGGGYVSKAYQQILEKEHHVFIYARGGKIMKGDSNWDQPNVTWAPWHYNGIKTKHFIKWIRKNKIDIAFFNEQRFWKPVLAAKKAGVCIGAYIDYYTQETVPAFEIYDFLICNTKRHYSVFNWHKNVYYIPWGTDIDKFKPEPKENSKSPVFIISAGWQPAHERDRRGSLLAINAFKNVKGDCKLIIYSQVKKENFSSSWKEAIKNDERIELKIGTFDPFPYNEGDVYLYPSRLDGIGLTLPEAISSGLAAITTNCAPMNEFVIDNYNGFLINVEKYLARKDAYYWAESICNIESLTTAMQTYVDHPEILNEHKKNSRDFALKYLNWAENASSITEIFRDEYLKKDNLISPKLIRILKSLDNNMSPSNLRIMYNAFRTPILNIFLTLRR